MSGVLQQPAEECEQEVNDPSNNDGSVISLPGRLSSFDIVCGQCHQSLNDYNDINYYSQRENLKTFLRRSFEGLSILSHYETRKTLNSAKQDKLCDLVIDRELLILIKKENVSWDRPLKRLQIPSAILGQLANEIRITFGERVETYYVASHTTSLGSVPAAGKFVSRIDYKRKCMIQDGLAVIGKRVSQTDDNTADSIDARIQFLKEHTEPWDTVNSSWIATVGARRELFKKSNGNPNWHFETFPCLCSAQGYELIDIDFKTKFPDYKANIEITWQEIQRTVEKFLASRYFQDEEEKNLLDTLPRLATDRKIETILMLLPSAVKSKDIPSRLPAKRRRTESQEERLARLNATEAFIVHVPIESDVDEILKKKIDHYTTQKQPVFPFIAIVGEIQSPAAYYCVIGSVRFKTETILEAFSIAFKSYATYNFSFPKSVMYTWPLLQTVLFRWPGTKSYVQVNKILTFFEKDMNVKY